MLARRGLATTATSVETPLAAKSLLRHTNIQTTVAHYIKSVPAEAVEAVRAMDKINALFDNQNDAVARNAYAKTSANESQLKSSLSVSRGVAQPG
jgi:hypothetical protein